MFRIKNCSHILSKSRSKFCKLNEFHLSAINHEQTVIAIRREDQSVWERRAPLAPKHVRKLDNKNN